MQRTDANRSGFAGRDGRYYRTRIVVIAMVLTWFARGVGSAAEPAVNARMRAHSCQREVRTVLSSHHWRIAEDKPGRLVGSRADQPPTPVPFVKVYMLTITFRPDSASRTVCAASIAAYVLERVVGGVQQFSGPTPANTPTNTEDIRAMIAEAEKQLVAVHPEYAGR